MARKNQRGEQGEMKKSGNIDFGKGPVWKCIMAQTIPLTLAQLVQLLYNVVDRIYIGHMEGTDGLALTGVGLTFPIVTLIMALSALFGTDVAHKNSSIEKLKI